MVRFNKKRIQVEIQNLFGIEFSMNRYMEVIYDDNKHILFRGWIVIETNTIVVGYGFNTSIEEYSTSRLLPEDVTCTNEAIEKVIAMILPVKFPRLTAKHRERQIDSILND